MSTFTVTSRAFHHPLPDIIPCPKCSKALNVFNITNKKGKHWGTAAECHNGCKDEDGAMYAVFCYDLVDLKSKIGKFK